MTGHVAQIGETRNEKRISMAMKQLVSCKQNLWCSVVYNLNLNKPLKKCLHNV